MRHKRVLFVNTNRFLYPPVIPLAFDYLLSALKDGPFVVDLADLCFSSQPADELEERVSSFGPDVVCMTIRNIDSALYQNNEYFLPEIRGFVEIIKRGVDVPVIIGGAALSADPRGILNYVGADCAVVGPGEGIVAALIEEAPFLRGSRKIIKARVPSRFCPERATMLEYRRYVEGGGIPGFETHKGCTSHCSYCIEAGTAVTFREPADVVGELRQLVEKGFDHLHLCDSEFNEDLDYGIELLTALVKENLGIKWALYMKPGNFNKKLFVLLKESGAYLITLSVDTFGRCPEYWQDVEKMVFLAKKTGIRISIDFLSGFPYEEEETLKEALDLFRRTDPDEVVVNVFVRIYGNTKIRRIIETDHGLKRFLLGSCGEESSFLSPCFYNHIPLERLRELIRGLDRFRIAGQEKGVNYQRALDGSQREGESSR